MEIDTDFGLIRATETTTASVHDSQVDLAKEGEVRYGDKGYFGAKTKGYDASMKKATRGHPLSYKDELRNKRISRKKSTVDRRLAFTKRICRAGHIVVTPSQGQIKNGSQCYCFQSLSPEFCFGQSQGVAVAFEKWMSSCLYSGDNYSGDNSCESHGFVQPCFRRIFWLYFQNPDELPRLVDIGDKVKLEFTVVSHEKNRCIYRYNVFYDGRIIESEFFALMPEESNLNKKTIEVNLIPNISSLVKMNSPNIEISRIRYNNTLRDVFSQRDEVEDGNIMVNSKWLFYIVVW